MRQPEKLTLTRTDCISLFSALGLKQPDRWDNERMALRLTKLKEMVDEDVELEEPENETLQKVLKAIDESVPMEVTDSAEFVEETETSVSVDLEPLDTEEETENEAIEKEVEEAKEEIVKPTPRPKDTDKPKPKGVRVSRTVAYVAGLVIKRYGVSVGVTDDLINEFCELRPGSTEDDARAALAYVWHALNAYTEEFPVS